MMFAGDDPVTWSMNKTGFICYRTTQHNNNSAATIWSTGIDTELAINQFRQTVRDITN